MQAAFLVTGAMFLTIGIATSIGGDATLWGTFIVVGTVFLTLGLVLAEERTSGEDAPDPDDQS